MESHRQGNGLQTFLEHWGLLVTTIFAVLASQLVLFFIGLSGAPWIWFFLASAVMLLVGGMLIGYAKLPGYRSGHWFDFGVKSVPENLQGVYRWGWRVFFFGAVLALGLLLSKQ